MKNAIIILNHMINSVYCEEQDRLICKNKWHFSIQSTKCKSKMVKQKISKYLNSDLYCSCCCLDSSVTPWTAAHQPRLCMWFPRQYWSGPSCPSLGHLPHPGTESLSFTSPPLAGRCFTTVPSGKAWTEIQLILISFIFVD